MYSLFAYSGYVLGLFTLVLFPSLVRGQGDVASNLGDVVIRFCDEDNYPKAVNYEVDAGEEKTVCLLLMNEGDVDFSVKIGFVDGAITNDDRQLRACEIAENIENFGQFVTAEETVFDLPANGSLETEFSVRFPESFAGMSYGCVVTSVVGQQLASQDSMFAIELRKANFIDFFVNGEVISALAVTGDAAYAGNNLSNSEDVYVYNAEGRGTIGSSLLLDNIGNIAQDATVTRRYNGMFFGKYLNDLGEWKIVPGSTMRVTDPSFQLPWYAKGLVSVAYEVDHQPIFDYEVEGLDIEDFPRETFIVSAYAWVWPWEMLAILLVLILLITYFVYRKKKASRNEKKEII